MTGVLPITKYIAGSKLNMFEELTFLNDYKFEGFYGFSDEVKSIMSQAMRN